jgi:hypothetical protein
MATEDPINLNDLGTPMTLFQDRCTYYLFGEENCWKVEVTSVFIEKKITLLI